MSDATSVLQLLLDNEEQLKARARLVGVRVLDDSMLYVSTALVDQLLINLVNGVGSNLIPDHKRMRTTNDNL